MALIKCADCGKEVSDRAKTCPNCGCPIECSIVEFSDKQVKSTKKSIIKKLLIIFCLLIVAVIAYVIMGITGCFDSVPDRDEQFYYGDIYLGMSKDEVKKLAPGELYDEDDTILTYTITDSLYAKSEEHQIMYSFKGGDLATIAIHYNLYSTPEEIIEDLKNKISTDYGISTSAVDYDGTEYYEWKTDLVNIKLCYDDVREQACVYYFRKIF